MLRDMTIDNNWWYTECQATYNIQSIDSSNAIILEYVLLSWGATDCVQHCLLLEDLGL